MLGCDDGALPPSIHSVVVAVAVVVVVAAVDVGHSELPNNGACARGGIPQAFLGGAAVVVAVGVHKDTSCVVEVEDHRNTFGVVKGVGVVVDEDAPPSY